MSDNRIHCLVDLDGTLLEGDRPIPGACAFIDSLHRSGSPFMVMTNSVMAPERIHRRLANAGMIVPADRILNPISAIQSHLDRSGISRVLVVGGPEEKGQLRTRFDEENPELIALLDFEECDIGYASLQHVFSLLDRDIPAVAASGSTWYRKNGTRVLDTGAFVRLFESAIGKTIPVFGKPNPFYFLAGVRAFGCLPAEVAVIGDDCTTDIRGGRDVGCHTVLVRTGKYVAGDEEKCPADRCVAGLEELIGMRF